jgi:hypothetical protein
MPAGAGALAACKRLEVQVMWRFLTTATIFVILLASSHASPAVAAKAASPHHYQTFRGKVVAPPYRYFRCKGGRLYAYGGGWGCDYYRYSYDLPLGRR